MNTSAPHGLRGKPQSRHEHDALTARARVRSGRLCHVGLTIAALLPATLLLSGCSLDQLIWGPDAARVIEVTNEFTAAAADGRGDSFACVGVDLDLREPSDWDTFIGQEPEEYRPEHWPNQADLKPDWSINLGTEKWGTDEWTVREGEQFPGFVFYRQNGDELCVVEVVWETEPERE